METNHRGGHCVGRLCRLEAIVRNAEDTEEEVWRGARVNYE
ncbi:hypothetical protein [Gloeocapsopsis sp. IPPAS B-1203]|nr:hypothetical protein [Gloeocapsopsis sp. IPPAS B-1203]